MMSFWERDQQRFYLKLRKQLQQAVRTRNVELIETVFGRLMTHLTATAQPHEDPLELVWKVAQSVGIDRHSPHGRIIEALKPVGVRRVAGGLVGSTKG